MDGAKKPETLQTIQIHEFKGTVPECSKTLWGGFSRKEEHFENRRWGGGLGLAQPTEDAFHSPGKVEGENKRKKRDMGMDVGRGSMWDMVGRLR